MHDIEAWDEAIMTGTRDDGGRVENVPVVVSTVYPEGHEDHGWVKVWPQHGDGKWWFRRADIESYRVVVRDCMECGGNTVGDRAACGCGS